MSRVSTLVVLLLVACSGPDGSDTGDDTPTNDGGTDTDHADDTDLPQDTDIEETDPPGDTDDPPADTCEGPGVCGVLIDPAGVPIGNFDDLLCCMISTCYKGETEADGSFYFEIDPGPYVTVAIKTHEELFETPLRWGAALVPAAIPNAAGVAVGNVHIPDLPAGVEFGEEEEDPQVLATGDGLELTLDFGDLTPDLGVFLHDIASRKLTADHIPTSYIALTEPVHAVYAIHPFATKSSSPIAVKLPSDLPAGTLVHLRTVSHIDGRFVKVVNNAMVPSDDPVIGHADGSFITTDPGQGITLLTHLVISTP
jgi:hypothetical protein